MRVKPGYVAPELVPKYKAPHIVRKLQIIFTATYSVTMSYILLEAKRRVNKEIIGSVGSWKQW